MVDVAGTHGKHQVPFPAGAGQQLGQGFEALAHFHGQLAVQAADGRRQGVAVHTGDRSLAGPVQRCQQHRIGGGEGCGKGREELGGAGVAVGLEHRHQSPGHQRQGAAAAGHHQPGHGQGGTHLAGVMGVVVHHLAAMPVAAVVKAPTRGLQGGDRLA